LLKRLAAIATARAKFDAVFCSVARLRRVVLLLSEAYLIFDIRITRVARTCSGKGAS
jgi:hypothetical protein